MTTEILFLIGMATSIVFIVVLLIEGAIRPGYQPAYHTGSALSLGDRGWIQIANFLQWGVGMFAYAAGVNRTLNTSLGAVLLAVFALGLIISGVFRMDPMRGYPPGTPAGTPERLSWHQQIHNLAGPVTFFAVFGACLVLAGQLEGSWRAFTVVTAIAGLALTISTAIAWQKDAPLTGLIQRGVILVYLTWIVLLGGHLL
jgi:hypothetical protein